MLFIVTAILSEITWYVLLFDKRQYMHSFGKFCSFRNDICIFLILNPKKQTGQRIYESFDAQGFRLELKVLKGGGNIYIYTPAFFLPLVFENSSQSFIGYSTVTSGFDPCALLSTGYRKHAKTILFGACNNSQPSATVIKARHCFKWGGGFTQPMGNL